MKKIMLLAGATLLVLVQTAYAQSRNTPYTDPIYTNPALTEDAEKPAASKDSLADKRAAQRRSALKYKMINAAREKDRLARGQLATAQQNGQSSDALSSGKSSSRYATGIKQNDSPGPKGGLDKEANAGSTLIQGATIRSGKAGAK